MNVVERIFRRPVVVPPEVTLEPAAKEPQEKPIHVTEPALMKADIIKATADAVNGGEGQYKLTKLLEVICNAFLLNKTLLNLSRHTVIVLQNASSLIGHADSFSILTKWWGTTDRMRREGMGLFKAPCEKQAKCKEKLMSTVGKFFADTAKVFLLLPLFGVRLPFARIASIVAHSGACMESSIDVKRNAEKYYTGFKKEVDAESNTRKTIAVERRRLAMLNGIKKITGFILDAFSLITIFSGVAFLSTGMVFTILAVNSIFSLWSNTYNQIRTKKLIINEQPQLIPVKS